MSNNIKKEKISCLDFIKELLKQLEMHLPNNENQLKQLSPNVMLSHVSKVPFSDLPFFSISDEDVESEYQIVNLISWNEISLMPFLMILSSFGRLLRNNLKINKTMVLLT